MAIALPLLIVAVGLLAWLQGAAQRAALAGGSAPFPARQIAYNMRLYHRAALAVKLANPGLQGVLAVSAPAFLTDWRFTSCASANAVVTYGSGLNSAQSRDVGGELLRQSAVPPELGLVNGSPRFANQVGVNGVLTGYAPGIGISDGMLINNGFASIVPACQLPPGVAAMQTQTAP
jgi:hypothetical protein